MRAFLLALLALTGCAELERLRQDPVDAIVAEVLSVSRASAAEQQAALGRAQQALKGDAQQALKGGGRNERLRLGALLATLPPPLRDDGRALELLESIADAGSPGAGRLAALLAAQLAERRRLVTELERQRAEADRAVRERAASEKERDKREEALKQQLEALRAIERGILEREEKLRRRK